MLSPFVLRGYAGVTLQPQLATLLPTAQPLKHLTFQLPSCWIEGVPWGGWEAWQGERGQSNRTRSDQA